MSRYRVEVSLEGVGGELAIGLAEIYPFLRRTGVIIVDIIY